MGQRLPASLILTSLLYLACASSPSAAPVITIVRIPPTDAGSAELLVTPSDAASGAAENAGSTDAAHSTDGAAGDSLKVCGCSLCAPVFSDDACTGDTDCAPATPCHADRCVARAKAQPRFPGLMCTQIMKCDSADANGCGCVTGRCALFPRKANGAP